MGIIDRMRGIEFPVLKKRLTKSFRKGRKYRLQQIVTWENDRPKVKTIIHKMF